MTDELLPEAMQGAKTEKDFFDLFNRCFPHDSNGVLSYRTRVYFFRELWRRAMAEGRGRARREMAKAIFGGDLFKAAPEAFEDGLSMSNDDTGQQADPDEGRVFGTPAYVQQGYAEASRGKTRAMRENLEAAGFDLSWDIQTSTSLLKTPAITFYLQESRKKVEIYADGTTEGLPAGTVIVNHIPRLIAKAVKEAHQEEPRAAGILNTPRARGNVD